MVIAAGSAPPASAQLSSIFSQGLTLHEKTSGSGMRGQERTTTSTTYFSGNAMKRVSSDGNDLIIRFDQGKIILIDNKKRTYTELTATQLQEAASKAAASAGEEKEAMEAMRKMMGQAMSEIKVTRQGPGETIAGYPTVKYLVTGPWEMEIWAAPDLAVPISYWDAWKAQAPRNPMFDMSKLYDEFKKIEGIHLKSVMTMKMMGMSMSTTTIVDSVEKGAIPASTFEIPAGYKAVPMKF